MRQGLTLPNLAVELQRQLDYSEAIIVSDTPTIYL